MMGEVLDTGVTQLLARWRAGEAAARDALFEKTYQLLKYLARRQLRGSAGDVSLSPTELVNEAYLRLVRPGAKNANDKRHFVCLSAQVMRAVCVDHLRKKHASKRPDPRLAVEFDEGDGRGVIDTRKVLDIHLALNEMEKDYPRQAQLVELRYFGGLSEHEAARALGIARSTVQRDWLFAKAWLAGAVVP